MPDILICSVDIPDLPSAAQARGLTLHRIPGDALPIRPSGDAPSAALLGCAAAGDAAARVAQARARGWSCAVMLALGRGGAGAVAQALDAGADDAVALPACPHEVIARLAARMRPTPPRLLRLGDLAIDLDRRRVTRAGRPLPLMPREYALLLCLARRAGDCVSRAELLAQVWELAFDPGTNVVQVHVSRLRAKLDRGFAAPMLHTVPRGYRLAPAIAAARTAD